MVSPDQAQVLQLLQTLTAVSFFEELAAQAQARFRQGIYTPAVVVWLMILQRLHPKGTLSAAVQTLAAHPGLPVLTCCKRVRQARISVATGGYCQARLKLPKRVAVAVSDHIMHQLQQQIQEGWPGLQRPVFLIDGSSLQLQHERSLARAFPPGRNQHGQGHWPVLKLVVLHDVYSGLALRPTWGPMYGPHAVSEQALACQAIERLPPEAVVLADRNFGIFAVAWAVVQSQRAFVFRLTEERARKIGCDAVRATQEQSVVWKISRWDRSHHPDLPADAQLAGRLLAFPHPAEPGQRLYLFTNLSLPAGQILALYGLRWNVETDLRSLKQTVRLHQLSSKSVDMMEKNFCLPSRPTTWCAR
ncbi:MAG: IS4 family transposase [Acidobacteriota bacterium]|nr:IS4 family transposase [Acidobacteriota bacterium]